MESFGDIKKECIDNYTEKFIDIFQKTLNIHAPLQKQSRKETKLKNKLWLSKGILKSIQQKIFLCKRALKLNNSNTWAQERSQKFAMGGCFLDGALRRRRPIRAWGRSPAAGGTGSGGKAPSARKFCIFSLK